MKAIYPVGFYHTKAKRLPEMAHVLLEEFDGKVPDTLEGLLSLPGVGRKTANLVLSLAFTYKLGELVLRKSVDEVKAHDRKQRSRKN